MRLTSDVLLCRYAGGPPDRLERGCRGTELQRGVPVMSPRATANRWRSTLMVIEPAWQAEAARLRLIAALADRVGLWADCEAARA
jgi:hypothetical protein